MAREGVRVQGSLETSQDDPNITPKALRRLQKADRNPHAPLGILSLQWQPFLYSPCYTIWGVRMPMQVSLQKMVI